MEIVVLGFLGFVCYLIYGYFFKSTASDKLALLGLGVWRSTYDKSGYFSRRNMAMGLLVNSVSAAEQFGSGVSTDDFMREAMKTAKGSVIPVLHEWLDTIHDGLSTYISRNDIENSPAVVVMGLYVLSMLNPSRFREVINSPETLANLLSKG